MRTTLTLDEDIARELHEASRKTGETFKAVVNSALRRGLKAAENPTRRLPRFVVQPKACGFRTGIDIFHLNKLNDELELEDFRRELAETIAKK